MCVEFIEHAYHETIKNRSNMTNHWTTRIRLLVAMLAAVLPLSIAKADDGDKKLSEAHGWYVGIGGGMPFGLSTFSSFGYDKTRLGWTAGIYGGYRFSPVLSAELSAGYGEMRLAAQDCCVDRQYWLGGDGVRYNASVLGMDSWSYADLTSCVTMGQYGARVNVNVLGLFHKTAQSRWQIALSPHLYAVSTKADVQTIADDADVMKGSTCWHLGYGADLQISYQLTSCLNIGVYSGLTRLTGGRMDGMPEYLHKNNYVWESGIRLGFNLSKKHKTTAVKSTTTTETYVQQPTPAPAKKAQEQPTKAKAETTVATSTNEAPTKVTFPTVYFAFNSIQIQPSEQQKLCDILQILKENPRLKVTVTGWCDTQGSVAVNQRISRQRANAVKAWLVKNGIEDSRITTVGNGSDDTKRAADARRVETTDNHNQ